MDSGEFLKFSIRFDKVKETRIYRKYTNFAQVAANIGGILKILLIFFASISGYISLNQYYLKLANEVFKFEYNNKNQKDKEKNDLDSSIDKEKISNSLTFKNKLAQFFTWGQTEHEK